MASDHHMGQHRYRTLEVHMKEHRTPGLDRANYVKWKSDTLYKTMGRLRVIKAGTVGL